MIDIDHNVIPAPACPMCSSPTVLKQRHKGARADMDTCVFKCTSCSVEYPVHVPASSRTGGYTAAAAKP